MKNNLRTFFKDNFIFEWYYILVILAYVCTLFSSLVRPGVFAAALMIVIFVELIFKKKMNIHNIMDVLIVVYFLYKLLTIICIINGNMPISVYTGEFAVSLLPMIFYFAGKAIGKRSDSFYYKFLCALFVLGGVGILLYILAPQFYCDYLYNWVYISKADVSTMRVRMQSVTGSTVFGAINIIGMCAGIYFLCDNGKDALSKKKRIFGIVATLFTFICGVLSNQRAAMVVGVVLILYINYLIFVKFEDIPKKYLFFELGAIVIFALLLCIVKFDFVLKVWWRIESLPSAISERSEQWVAAVNNMYSSWFGNGLGANGHKAIGIEGAHVIADGGLIKMYCEEGVLGFSLFVYILFLTLMKSVKNIGRDYAEFGVILAALLLSIGSNVLAFQLVTPIFWFAIGRIWEISLEDEKINLLFKKRGENK